MLGSITRPGAKSQRSSDGQAAFVPSWSNDDALGRGTVVKHVKGDKVQTDARLGMP